VALQGTIKDFGLPDIFQLIGLQRKTGILTLVNEKDKESVTVTFENGMVVMSDSSHRRLEDRLGNVLVKQGKVSRERLEEALATQKQTLQRLGHILASTSAITTRDLREALQVQVSQIVFRVFRWRDGRYQFSAADTVDYDRENFVPMSTDFILMEGIRMVDEWPIIEKRIPSLDIVFRPVIDPSLIEVGAGAAPDGSGEVRTASSTGKIRLASSEEERVFRKVDGVRTVQGIIDATGAGEFEVCRTLFDFLNRNLISPAGKGTNAERADAAEVEAVAAGSPMPGYGLAGLVAALALVGLLVQHGSPFAVTGLGSLLPGTYDVLREDALRSRLMRLERALEAWRVTYGRPPATLDELVPAGLVPPAYLFDPWSRPIRYQADAAGYLLSASDESGASRPGTTIDRRGGR
jgi:Domain of unknown function (DUF4388)